MSDLPSHLSRELAGRYEIERELGRGGMATVYLARDLRHDRPVALKVLRSEVAGALGAERFDREIRLAARLQHPNILTVHESGTAASPDGPLYWYTMPYVEGETLRARLDRLGQLPVDEAVRVACGLAEALGHAHGHGVIHRDIKPENILMAGPHALVADFGIGKALSGANAQRLTETGFMLGTPAYMSPEQASGDSRVDERSDIYSLGAVIYEMLAGEPPFRAPTAQAMIAKRFTGEVPSVRSVRGSVPTGVAAAVTKALALLPADRHASMAELSRALRSGEARAVAQPERRVWRVALFLALIGAVLVAGLLARQLASPRPSGAGQDAIRRLAVLPFDNLGDSADAYFADGVTDAVRGKLTTLPGLQVTASNSSNEYRATRKPPRQIGEELGVEYLLIGRVRWAHGPGGTSRVQLSPELIEVATGAAIWQAPFDASLTDIFSTQGDIAARVAAALGVALGARQSEQLHARPTLSLAAYDAFLRGEAESQSLNIQEPLRLRRAAAYYDQAIALDSTFALAWAQRSRAHAQLYFLSTPDPEEAEGAQRASERARQLSPGLVEAYLAKGDYYAYIRQDAAAAVEAYRAGLALAPASAALLANLARSERFLGRWDAALQHAERAYSLDPRSSRTAWILGFSYLTRGRFDDAMAAIDRGLIIAPENLDLAQTKAMIHLARGDLPAAQRIARRPPTGVDESEYAAYFAIYWDLYWLLDARQQEMVLALPVDAYDGNPSNRAFVQAEILWSRGDTTRARAAANVAEAGFARQLAAAPGDAQLHALRGLALAYLGRYDEATRLGERAVELESNLETRPYFRQLLLRIYVLAGQRDRAIAEIERLLDDEYFVTPGWLRVDPTLRGLRGNPRFDALATATATGTP
jgi:serine/threonine-protein kinase